MPVRPTSAIPVGTQFSPDLIDLHEFLKVVIEHSGDKAAIQKATFAKPVHLKRNSLPSSRRTASLPLEAAVQYGLLTQHQYEATDLARELAQLQRSGLFDRFARHILLNCNGLKVIEAIEQMQMDYSQGHSSVRITADTLARYLTDSGLTVGEHNGQINTMRMYLAKAGIFPSSRGEAWKINRQRVHELLGVSNELMEAIEGFAPLQQEFALALCRLNPTDWILAARVRDYVERTGNMAMRFPRGNSRTYIAPLEEAGLIEIESGGTQSGKSTKLKTTSLFQAEVLEPFFQSTSENLSLDSATTRYFRLQPQTIFGDLESTQKHRKGIALEALAIYIMRLLGLRLRGWRRRAADTGGAEVDVLMSGILGGIATKWQVQCKNTPNSSVRLEDLAKEVGLVGLTGVTHLLFLTTGKYTSDAEKYALRMMQTSSLSIYLLDGGAVDRIRDSATALTEILNEKSKQIQSQWLNRPAWLDNPVA